MMPLAKLALGAEGDGLQELLKAIGVKDVSKIKLHFQRLIAEMKYLPRVKIALASRLYLSDKFRLRSVFREKAREIFESSLDMVNYENAKSTADLINKWVSKQTKGNIKQIVDASELKSDTVLTVINAIYFKGKWKEEFIEGISNFQTPTGTKTVSIMTQNTDLNYTESTALDAQLVVVPYIGEKAYLLIVLPNKANGLSKLLKDLRGAPDKLDKSMIKMEETFINLTLPVFKIESEINLIQLYKEVGVRKIFEKESGLNQIVRNQTIYVTDAKQKAIIEVTREGTVAAVVSGSSVSQLTEKTPINVHVRHPFLCFIIMQNQQLFSAVVVDPTLGNTK